MASDNQRRDDYLVSERGLKAHDRAGSIGWELMKSIVFDGRSSDDIYDFDDEIQGWLNRWHEDKKLPPLPWLPQGKRRGTPWTEMKRVGSSKPLHDLPGFQKPSSEMIPSVINWIGGKTSIQPTIRGIFDEVPNHRPAEVFGGSGSTIFGLNRDDGFYADINPDNTNLMSQMKIGMGDVPIAQNQEQLEDFAEQMNALRRRRDVEGKELDDDEKMALARLFVGTNLQHRNGMFDYEPWDAPAKQYTEGRIKRPNFRASKVRVMPHEVGSINLDPYAKRLKNVEIHTGDFRDTSKLLDRNDAFYLDPQYIGRDIQYGGSDEQKQGVGFDQLQRDTLKVGAEHEGPVLLSNYMYDPKTGKPFDNYIESALDHGYQIHPWLRKPKGNKNPVVEMLATRNFPEKLNSLKRFMR